MKTKQIILALLLSAVPVFAQEGPNLVVNPGFEADAPGTVVPSGWGRSDFLNSQNLGNAYVQKGGHSGNNCFRFTGQQFQSVITQTVSVSQPGTYIFRAWCRYPGGAAQVGLRFFYTNTGSGFQNASVSPKWTLVEMNNIVITDPGSYKIEIDYITVANSTFDVDDVEFVRAEPTPTVRSLTVKTKHMPGDQVPIKAPRNVNGLVFDRWVGDTGALENFTSPNTTATIPSTLDVQVEATYKQP